MTCNKVFCQTSLPSPLASFRCYKFQPNSFQVSVSPDSYVVPECNSFMPVITEYGPSPEYGPTPEFGPPLAGPLLGSYGPLPDPNADDTLTGKPSSQFIHI